MTKSSNTNGKSPNLRFPEFSGEWKNYDIHEILKIGSGKDYKHLKKGDIPVFGTGGFMTFVDDYLFDGETVCIGRKGTINKPFFYRGKLWTVDTLFYTHSFQKVIPKFVYYLFENINWLKYNEASGVPSLSKKTIEKIKISLPEIVEQEKISSLLVLINERIKTQNEIIDKYNSLMHSASYNIFNQKLRFLTDYEKSFPNWIEMKLSEIGKTLNGLTGKSKEDFGSGRPYIQYKQIFGNSKIDISECGKVQISETDNQIKFQYGDIFFTTSSETPYEIGTSSVLLDEVEEVLYVDKSLKYHGLIQAYSRTNRILNEKKSQGNIVVFRNLKKVTDEAITLFSNKDAIEVIIMEPYEDYLTKFNDAYERLIEITPDIDSVNDLMSEEDEFEFIKAFRELMRLRNTLMSFADFDWNNLEMDEQEFNDFRGKHLDLWQKVKHDTAPEKVSILNDVDFELELIHRDNINVTYILKLLAELKNSSEAEKTKKRKEIVDILTGEVNLRSKRDLIEKFIQENLPKIENSDIIPEEFEKYWSIEEKKAFDKFIKEENLSPNKTQKLIENYLYAEREPLRDELLDLIEGEKPSVLKRKSIGDRLLQKVVDFVETFINGFGG